MIQYALKCDRGHSFDSWFQSASAFDKLLSTGMVSCAVCGGTDVEKAVMAPSVRAGPSAEKAAPLTKPASPAEQALLELRRKIERNSEYVGMNFATEARAMHHGDAPERSIYGEASAAEARKLVEDGVPVLPLPFTPHRKTN
jgi:hypothetical protein